MQEVYHDGSKGKLKAFDSLEEMLPKLKKSLKKKKVKLVNVMMIPGRKRLKGGKNG